MTDYCEEDSNSIKQKSALIEQMKINAFADQNIIYIWEEIDSDTAFVIVRMMEQLEEKNVKKITLKINSIGGDVFSAFPIISKMEEMKCKGIIVETIAYGKCMSCALAIMQCGTKGYRKSQKYTRFTLHQVSSLDFGYSTVEESYRKSEEIKEIWNAIREITKNNSCVDDKLLDDITTHIKDYSFFADKALSLKFIDEIL